MRKIQKHKKHNFCESQDRNNNTTALISSTYTAPPKLKPDGHHKITATQKNSPDWLHEGEKTHKSTNPQHQTQKKKFKIHQHWNCHEQARNWDFTVFWRPRCEHLRRLGRPTTPPVALLPGTPPSLLSSVNSNCLLHYYCLSITRSIDRSSFPAR